MLVVGIAGGFGLLQLCEIVVGRIVLIEGIGFSQCQCLGWYARSRDCKLRVVIGGGLSSKVFWAGGGI